jgi:hypothetical protein
MMSVSQGRMHRERKDLGERPLLDLRVLEERVLEARLPLDGKVVDVDVLDAHLSREPDQIRKLLDVVHHGDRVRLDDRGRPVPSLRVRNGGHGLEEVLEHEPSPQALARLRGRAVDRERQDVQPRRAHQEVGQLRRHQHAVRHDVRSDPSIRRQREHLRNVLVHERLTEAAQPVLHDPRRALIEDLAERADIEVPRALALVVHAPDAAEVAAVGGHEVEHPRPRPQRRPTGRALESVEEDPVSLARRQAGEAPESCRQVRET